MFSGPFIIPIVVLSAAGLSLIFRIPWRRWMRRFSASQRKGDARKYSFDGAYSPYAYSSLSMLRYLDSKKRPGAAVEDSRLAETVKEALQEYRGRGLPSVDQLVVESWFGRLVISGVVQADSERELAESIAYAVPGVVDISNQIRVYERRGA